jgi:hypothetical protein
MNKQRKKEFDRLDEEMEIMKKEWGIKEGDKQIPAGEGRFERWQKWCREYANLMGFEYEVVEKAADQQ